MVGLQLSLLDKIPKEYAKTNPDKIDGIMLLHKAADEAARRLGLDEDGFNELLGRYVELYANDRVRRECVSALAFSATDGKTLQQRLADVALEVTPVMLEGSAKFISCLVGGDSDVFKGWAKDMWTALTDNEDLLHQMIQEHIQQNAT